MHILVPMDGSDASVRALRMGARMVTGAGVDLTVVHFTDEETDATDTLVARAREILDEMNANGDVLVKTGTDLEFRPEDRAGEAILDFVDAQDVDHVIMGHHGAGAIELAMLGSATERVLEAKRVPVTVVP